VNNTKSIPILN